MELQEYLTSDATALASLVSAREVTATELLGLARRRADEVNPRINAVVGSSMDELADARANEPLGGPFAGVPFLIKDLAQDYAGLASTSGSRSLEHDIATEHAVVTQRFLDAGLVIFGKTNTPEFGAKGITEDSLLGTARNPWGLEHTPGGSSGGSGAAVAAGIVPAAGASDGGGSIRIPAACNGLVGLKVSRGLSPYGPQSGESIFGLGVHGVVSRTVRDSAGLLDAVAGAPQRYAGYVAGRPGNFLDALEDRPAKLRIGYSWASSINASPDPEAIAAVEETAVLLTDLGHEVEAVSPPHDDAALARDFLSIWFAHLYGQVTSIKRRLGVGDSAFEADTLAVAEIGRAGGVGALVQALASIPDYTRALDDFYERYDLFLTPTLAEPPLKVGSINTPKPLQTASRVIARIHAGKLLNATGVLDQLISENLSWVPYTQLANMTGRPAISVPLHWTAAGLPLGIQLVGPLASDAGLLCLAAQLEQAQPWFQRYANLDATLTSRTVPYSARRT